MIRLRIGAAARAPRGTVLRPLLLALALGLLATFTPAAHADDGRAGTLSGDPFQGRELFEEKRCVSCHSVWGHGGALATDIARAVSGKTVLQLAGEFWNHTPRMIDETLARGYEWPVLERDEMADLLSYLYYLQLLDAPGDPARGAYTWVRLRCDECHAVGGGPPHSGGALDRFSRYLSSVPLAQAMWNAGPAMQSSQIGRGNAIPEFTGPELADLQAYIREHSRRPDGNREELLKLPDPVLGGALYLEKGCVTCHGSPREAAAGIGVAARGRSVAEIGGILWNHSYAMQASMRARGVAFPRFRENELADLISYIYMLGFLQREGNASSGSVLFEQAGCTACHAGDTDFAADLLHEGVADPVTLTATMWNHAPEMHELMAERGVAWPQFEEREMEDLAAYLASLATAKRDSGR